MDETTVGARVFAIRAAMGDGPRKPLSQEAFAARLNKEGGRTFYGPEFSLIERNKKDLTRDDIAIIAAVDPLNRGKLWLGWGEEKQAPVLVEEKPGDIRAAQPISGMGSVPHGVPITPDVPQQKKGKGGGR